VFGVGIEEDDTPLVSDLLGPPVVDAGCGVIPDARVAMVKVVPAEEATTVRSGVLETAESVGEVGAVLEGSEL
jgi:hypothetical protein